MTEITLRIDGMHCGSCIRRVSDALASTDGVQVKEVRLGAARLSAPEDPAPAPQDPRQPRHRTALTTEPDNTRPQYPSPAPRSPPACPEPGHTAPKAARQARTAHE